MAEYRDVDATGVTAVRLTFGDADVFVSVDDETDEVVCTSQRPDRFAVGPWSDRTPIFWRPSMRKRVQWFWPMRNHRGYDDGLQVEFADPDRGGDRFAVQMIAMASRLSVRVVVEVL